MDCACWFRLPAPTLTGNSTGRAGGGWHSAGSFLHACTGLHYTLHCTLLHWLLVPVAVSSAVALCMHSDRYLISCRLQTWQLRLLWLWPQPAASGQQ